MKRPLSNLSLPNLENAESALGASSSGTDSQATPSTSPITSSTPQRTPTLFLKRRDFLRSSSVLGATTALGLTGKSASAQTADSPPTVAPNSVTPVATPVATPEAPPFGLKGAPVVGYTTQASTTITWAVQGPSTAWVEYGETPQLGTLVKPSVAGLHPYESLAHKVQIQGLKPNTRYHYRTFSCAIDFTNPYKAKRGETLASAMGTFKTLNPRGESASFVIWNDTHANRETLTTLHSLTSKIAPDFLFINGDISNDVISEAKAVELYLNPYDLPFAQNYPLFFSRGNHDVRGKAARELPRFVSVPDNQFYYSFRQGPLAVLVMDTGEDKPDSHPDYAGLVNFEAYRTMQQQWLEREIQKPEFRNAPFRVLLCHIPLWWRTEGSGTFCLDARQKWHELLVKARIQLVVSGHTHRAFHLPPTSLHPYHQLIGGGPKPEQATIIKGEAKGKTLTLSMQDLSGKELTHLVFTA